MATSSQVVDLLLVTGLSVSALLLCCSTCTLIDDVAPVNGIVLIFLCKVLTWTRTKVCTPRTELLLRVTTVVVLGRLNAGTIALNGNLGLAGAGLVVVVDGCLECLVVGAHVDGDWKVWA